MKSAIWKMTVLLLSLLLSTSIAIADESAVIEFKPAQISLTLAKLEKQLNQSDIDREQLNTWSEELLGLRNSADQCVSQLDKDLGRLRDSIGNLPAVAEGESKDITQQRHYLAEQEQLLSNKVLACRLLSIRIVQLADQVLAQRRLLVANELFYKELPLWKQLFTIQPQQALQYIDFDVASVEIPQWGWLVLAAIGALLLVSIGLRLKLLRVIQPNYTTDHFADYFYNALKIELANYLPWLTLLTAISVVSLLTVQEIFLKLTGKALSGLWLLTSIALLAETLLSPPADFSSPLLPKINKPYFWPWRLRILVFLLAPIVAMLIGLNVDTFWQIVESLSGSQQLYGVLLAIWTLYAIWPISKVLRKHEQKKWALRFFIMIMFSVILLETVGYHNLAQFIWQGIMSTIVILTLAWAAHRIIYDVVADFENARFYWQQKIHARMGLKPNEKPPGLIWIKIIGSLFIWCAAGLFLLKMWGLPDEEIRELIRYLRFGFEVGSVKLIPLNIVSGILLFSVLILLIRWLKRRLERSWLVNTRLDRGARDAVASITWYTGLILALLSGMAIAGVNIAGLAIIAGAISVGVGFGLQNVVSNFISGLILLIERPVKPGDWVVVGNVEGYVQKINIRSTRIQTFERADVIVPNSDLITHQVSNWMLNDPYGRAIVPIAVTHNTDVRKAEKILLEIAEQHPLVIADDHGIAPPKVLFRGFADTSLTLELRVMVRNVEKRLETISDINFEIDRRFRAEGIDIPVAPKPLPPKPLLT